MPRRLELASAEQLAVLRSGARGPVKRRRPEGDFTIALKRCARASGWLPYHTFRSKGSDPGFPDLLLVRLPRLVIAELKVAGNQPTEWQELWLAAWECLALLAGPQLSIEVYVWSPEDWAEIERVLA